MANYLLPCITCGQAILITKAQAGQEVTCSCGSKQIAPTLREIQQLPVQELAVSQQKLVKMPWTKRRTMVFAAGLIVTAVAIAVVVRIQVKILGINATLPSKQEMKDYEEGMNSRIIEGLELEQTYDQFLSWKKIGLGEQISRAFEQEHERLDGLRLINGIVAGIGIFGFLVTLGAMLWPRRSIEARS